MAQATTDGRALRRLDPFAIGAGAFLLLALAFGAYLAFRAGPASLGGALMLEAMALPALALLLPSSGLARSRGPGPNEGIEAVRLIQAVQASPGLTTADGRILASNPGWAEAAGAGSRLPKSIEAGGLFAALGAARRGEVGSVRLKLKRGARSARVSMLDESGAIWSSSPRSRWRLHLSPRPRSPRSH